MDDNPENLIKKAQKALKKGVLKWKRDFPGAVMYYDQAIKIYKNHNQYNEV